MKTIGRTWSLLFVLLGGCHHWPAGIPVPENLYSYGADQVLNAVNAGGFTYTRLLDVQRNTSGTKLFVRTDSGTAVFVFSGSGPPQLITAPGNRWGWLDNEGQVVAWRDAPGFIAFRYGTVREVPFGVQSGAVRDGYYFETNPAEGSVCIFDLRNHEVLLFSYQTNNTIEDLVARDGQIWVLEVDLTCPPEPGPV